MTKKNSIEIVFVVDRSGSMTTIAADMRGGFDTFIERQRAVPGECNVTMVQFDDKYEVEYQSRPLQEVRGLNLVPRGSRNPATKRRFWGWPPAKRIRACMTTRVFCG